MNSIWFVAGGALFFALAGCQSNNNAISLNISRTPPPGASQVLEASFAGFGIEPSNLFSFAGGTDANDLSVNLLQNLADYTGTPPAIRLGGNTGDYFIWQDSYNDYSTGKNEDSTGQGAIASDSEIIGPSYFKALDRFPKNTPVIFGINLAYDASDYMDQIAATAKAALSGLKNVKLTAFEIGNEPDLYLKNGFRTGAWDGTTYTQQWLSRAQTIYDRVLKPAGLPSNFFEPAATASTIGTSFEIKDLITDGITVQANNSANPLIGAWNQHDYYYYIGVSTYQLTLSLFTDLSTTTSQFAAWTQQIQQALSPQPGQPSFPYYLREMAAVGPVGMDGITNTFAASLWTLNFFLYAATLNISGVNMHMTDNSNASAWQPIEMYGQGPHVRPAYYGFAAMAQIIGEGCSTRVAAISLPDLPSDYTNRVVAYATYRGSPPDLAAVTVINTRLTSTSSSDSSSDSSSSSSNIPSLTLSLSVGSSLVGTNFSVSRLTGPAADARSNTTWNGISYEKSGNDGKPATVSTDDEIVKVAGDGTVTVSVRDSEAVVVNRGAKLGSEQSESACQKGDAGNGNGGGDQGGKDDGGQGSKTPSSATNPAAASGTATATASGGSGRQTGGAAATRRRGGGGGGGRALKLAFGVAAAAVGIRIG